MRCRLLPLIVSVLWAFPLLGQTYYPKVTRIEGAAGMDQAELTRLLNLPSGPVTKAQIDAAVQRLGGSGLFAEIRYTVGPDALVFILKPAPGTESLPVRFTNFAWWKPGELEPLVEARVPLFHGKLPLHGQLTDQVQAALVALLDDKGIHNAQVSARLSALGGSAAGNEVNAVAFSIDQPQVMLRKIQLTGIAPEVASKMDAVLADLTTQDFDTLLSPKAIVDNASDVHRNAGYLDVTVQDPFFSEPYKETVGYGVDASAVVYPGARYHVTTIAFEGLPPGTEAAVAKAAGIHPGDPAGEMTVRVAQAAAAAVLHSRGMLEATASAIITKNSAAHTVAYRLQIVPGPTYSFAGLDISALTAAQQALFLHSFHVRPGVTADETVRAGIIESLRAAGASRATIGEERNRATHKVTYILKPLGQRTTASG